MKGRTQEPRPVLKIVDFQVSDAPVGGQARAEVTVFNEGDSTGEFCTVWWYSGSEVAHQLEQGLLPGQAATSEEFGLRPEETRQITVWSLPYGEPGRFRSWQVSMWRHGHPSSAYVTVSELYLTPVACSAFPLHA